MGRTGSCCDNAGAESFFGLLEAEIGTTVWESYDQARADAFHFIEVGYNRTRLRKHPVCGYVTPVETRALTAQALTPQRNHSLSMLRRELHHDDVPALGTGALAGRDVRDLQAGQIV
ncbi:IS3 family transposase [Streptomyces sp. NPDC096105]|uniref:IS3 family transposase n=1 Tax=Streptomyces sp. NPDC096105 TaxID=3366074 RepID=UPI00380F6816